MGGCCGKNEAAVHDNSEERFEKGGSNDIQDGPVKNRGCTDIFCIPIFLFAQVMWFIVTIAGVSDGNPTKLYKPRDYQGAYCGVEENWNSGPNTENAPSLSYTMNVTSTVDVIMKQLICSSVAETALTQGGSGISALLTTTDEKNEYLCDCCLIPCTKCQGSLEVGGDLASGSDLSDTIGGRMSELTDTSKAADLFSPAGENADTFSATSFWEEATKYFIATCLPDCSTDYSSISTSTARNYTYMPSQDSDLYDEWNVLLSAPSNTLTQTLKDTIANSFTFKALPFSVCPYDESICVPFPGISFSEVGADRCAFTMATEVIDAVGSTAASAFTSLGLDSFTESGTETFGEWVGDFQKTIDTFIVVAIMSFGVGFAFLVLLRLFISICVWTAVASTVLMFALGGCVLFVRSGQCKGAGFFETGTQNAVAVTVAAKVAAENAVSGTEAVSEYMTGDGGQDAGTGMYKGVQHYTKSGMSCVNWASQTVMPDYIASNYPNSSLTDLYCRNPYNVGDSYKAATIWCITSDPDKKWEECTPVGVIQPECDEGYAVTGETAREALYYSAIVVWALGGVWVLIILCFVQRIRLAIALNKVAAEFLASNPFILTVPAIQAICAIIWCIIWCLSASFLLSQVPDDYTPKVAYETYAEAYGTASSCAFWEFGDECSATPGKCNDKWPTGSVWKDTDCETDGDVTKCWRCAPPRYVFDVRFAISFFVFLWNNAFNVALGQAVIAMAVAIWFFTTEKGKTPVVMRGVKTMLKYHTGSIAFGSFIVAVVQFIRYFMKYLEKQAQAQKNRVLVMILKVVQCCIWCFEKCVKFLNKNAYIQIALTAKNFCISAKKAFFLIMRNALRFGTVAVLGSAIHFIGFVCIMSGTAVVGYFLVRAMHEDVSPLMPVIFYVILSYIVAKLFMSVFQLAVDTSLQCFLAVEEMGGGGDYVPSCLKSFVNKNVVKD